jgi:hypothetical protein
MKKPKDVADLASRLASAASTPLMAPPAAPVVPTDSHEDGEAAAEPKLQKPRKKASNRGTVAVFLRMSETLFTEYDQEAVRRTKASGRGVTVQQVILDRLAAGKGA